MPKGGRKPSDYKPRASGPGALSRRTDLSGTQPVRAPVDLPYGDRNKLEQQQQAVPVPEGGALGEQQPAAPSGSTAAGPSTADLSQLLTSVPTQNPNQHIAEGTVGPPPPDVVNAAKLSDALEQIIQSGPVSQSLMDFYLGLRAQARLPQVPKSHNIPSEPVEGYKLLQ